MRTVIRKRYSDDFKAQAVALLNLGRSVPEVAEELRRLRKQNAHLLMENDILKKAAVILGTPPPSKPAR